MVGGGLLVLTLVVQPPLQMPLRGVSNIQLRALGAGLIAGFVQEGLKMSAVVKLYDKSPKYALHLGLGFGLGEWGLALLSTGVALTLGLTRITVMSGFLGSVERVSSILFHMASASLLAYFALRRRGLLGYLMLSLLHGAVDWMAAGLSLSSSLENQFLVGLAEALWLSTSVGFLILGLRGVLHGEAGGEG